MGKLKITLKRSTNSTYFRHKRTVEALGLKKVGQSVEREDTPAVRGMVRQVNYLVDCEEI